MNCTKAFPSVRAPWFVILHILVFSNEAVDYYSRVPLILPPLGYPTMTYNDFSWEMCMAVTNILAYCIDIEIIGAPKLLYYKFLEF